MCTGIKYFLTNFIRVLDTILRQYVCEQGDFGQGLGTTRGLHQLNLSRKLAHVHEVFLLSSRMLVKKVWYTCTPAINLTRKNLFIYTKLSCCHQESLSRKPLVFMYTS